MMDFPTIGGLPAHPLIVHAVVVLVPLAALLVAASALSTRFRHWSRYATPLVALVGLVMVPLASQSGEGLERSVPHSALIEQHAELADSLLPLMVAVTVVAFLQLWMDRRSVGRATDDESPRRGPLRQPVVGVAVMVLALLVSAGTLVQVGRIGHSGAKAAWNDVKVSSGGEESGAPRP